MKKKDFFKILMAGFFLFMFSAISFAQDQSVAVDAQSTYSVTDNGNSYQWYIYTDSGLTTAATATTDYTVEGGSLTSASVTLAWPKAGTYYLVLTETNVDCSTDNEFTVEVLDVEATVIASAASLCSSPGGNATFTFQLVDSGTTTANSTTSLDGMTVDYRYSFNGTDWTTVNDASLNNEDTFTVAYTAQEGNGSRTLTVQLLLVDIDSGGTVALHTSDYEDTTTLYDNPAANSISAN